MSKHWFAFLAAAVFALSVGSTFAEVQEGESLADPKTEAEAFDIASRTMSPFCPGRTLADCPSGNATEWRQDIRRMLKEGKSAAEIQKILSQRAGENLSGAPESSLGWALPVGLCLGALLVLTLVVKRIRGEDDDRPVSKSPERDDADEDDEDEDDEDDDERDDRRDAADDPKASAEQAKRDRELEERLRRELADEEGS